MKDIAKLLGTSQEPESQVIHGFKEENKIGRAPYNTVTAKGQQFVKRQEMHPEKGDRRRRGSHASSPGFELEDVCVER